MLYVVVLGRTAKVQVFHDLCLVVPIVVVGGVVLRRRCWVIAGMVVSPVDCRNGTQHNERSDTSLHMAFRSFVRR
jgi:hypothetical protein